MKIGIVVSEWYWDEITGPMAGIAEETAKNAGAETITVRVPGSFDIPLACKRLLDKVDGIVTLGAIVQGDTAHDEVIAHAVAGALQQLMLEHDIPIMLGVTGPRMTYKQAKERVTIAEEYVKACIRMVQDG